MNKPLVLCILDGLGLNPKKEGNAVAAARKPNLDWLMQHCPWTTLITCGERVGLPDGQMGNSEVGHLNIGAGRVVEQWLLRISNALKGSYLKDSPDYQLLLKSATTNSVIHLVGLYSTGGVHSQKEHLHLLIKRLSQDFQGKIVLHLITDGRDVSPQSAVADIEGLQAFLTQYPHCTIQSICGRFFTMDRDKRWERTQKGYDAIVRGIGARVQDPISYLKDSYASGVTDEFIEPAILGDNLPTSNDLVIYWNFREDRMRQIVGALSTDAFTGFARTSTPFPKERSLGFTEYDHTYHIPFLFPALDIQNHLGEVLSKTGIKQLRVAETEKYAHVTYFFNGGKEVAYEGEDRSLVPSPRDVKTYDEKPEMSAFQVCDIVLDGISNGQYKVIIVNFANCDMVGHTGSIPAATHAVETVDICLGRILERADKHGWQVLVTADHGNAEQMVSYKDGTPHTAHTLYPVPLILKGGDAGIKLADGGALCDIAPTILELVGVQKPVEMTGGSLVVR